MEIKKVIFLIPFRSKASTNNWDIICRNLSNTIKSIQNQTNDNFRVIIVGNEMPMYVNETDNLKILTEDFQIPNTYSEMQFDIRIKLFTGMKYARKFAPCYLFRIDADDLIHRNLVSKILASNSNGFYFYFGYDLSVATKALMLRPRFYMNCGTAHVLKLEKSDFPRVDSKISSDDWFNDIWQHQHIDKLYKKYSGKRLRFYVGAPIVRIVNTGSNMEFNRENSFKGIKGLIAKMLLIKRITSSKIKNFTIPKEYVS